MIATPRAELEQEAMRLARITTHKLWRPGLYLIEKADLLGAAYLGATKALARWDPARGVKFSSFAISHIKGAISEELRIWDHLTREYRKKARRAEEATGETPAWLRPNASLEDVRWALKTEEGFDSLTHEDSLPDPDADTERDALARITREELLDLISWLPAVERRCILEHFWEERTLKQFSRDMGKSESRGHQIARQAIERLRRWAEEGLVAG